ncbi:hypothetical protein E2C01_057046 [Portunus trituberculatus]|uniref:Uncharacterized protein n=1 Tax=Portunus trituberculatus TaxID=210409 RepID=A0A5B7H006_PORTR|nr:hypothetical protein [Portunus trituberculatus]
MNAHIGLLDERMNRNGEMLEEFVNEMELENLNVTLAEGQVTWNAREHESAIDYMLVNGRMREIVEHLNERLVGNVWSAAENQIGYVRVGRRKRVCKPWWNNEIREVRKERKRMSRQCRWLRKRDIKAMSQRMST